MGDEQNTSDLSTSPKIHFEPIISLPLVETKALEEDETELLKLRAKLFRFDSNENPAEWKERGTGEVKILKHKDKKTCRILMRRDKTLKTCANHIISANMELKPNCGSEKAWVWSVAADYADEDPKPELLAIRFGNVENAQKFKKVFEEAQNVVTKDTNDTKSESNDINDTKSESNDQNDTKSESNDQNDTKSESNDQNDTKNELNDQNDSKKELNAQNSEDTDSNKNKSSLTPEKLSSSTPKKESNGTPEKELTDKLEDLSVKENVSKD